MVDDQECVRHKTVFTWVNWCRRRGTWRSRSLNKLGILLGAIVLAVSFAVSPMPLTVSLENPTRNVVIYPNVLFAVPLMLLGALLLLYGATAEKPRDRTA